MAGRKLARRNQSRSTFPKQAVALVWTWLMFCVSLFCQAAAGEPLPQEPSQWKAGIERPTRGWDYDGKRILGHIGYDICLWDAETGELLHRMKGHMERINLVQFSPDGNHALTSSWMPPAPMQPNRKSKDTSTILWNLATGRDRAIFKGQIAGEFSPDGKCIVTFSRCRGKRKITYEDTDPETGKIRRRETTVSVTRFDAVVWETYTGRQLVTAKLDEYSDPKSDTLHFSPDGRHFIRLGDTTAVLYNTDDGREIGRIDVGNTRSGRSECGYTSTGALAFVDREKFQLTDIESDRVIHSVPHGLKRTDGFAWTHDGGRVAVLRDGEAIQIWDIVSGKATTGAKHGPYPSQAAVASPDNRRLAVLWSGSERDEQALGMYDMKTGKEIFQSKLPELAGMIGFSPDSKTLLIGGSKFVIYNAKSGETIRTLRLLNDADVDRWTE